MLVEAEPALVRKLANRYPSGATASRTRHTTSLNERRYSARGEQSAMGEDSPDTVALGSTRAAPVRATSKDSVDIGGLAP